MHAPGRTIVIDPEFAFYGPMGFDLGAVVRTRRLQRSYRLHGIPKLEGAGKTDVESSPSDAGLRWQIGNLLLNWFAQSGMPPAAQTKAVGNSR